MLKKDRVEMERAKILKLYRFLIRQKHSFAADEEINETLPRIEEQFNKAVAAGKSFELDSSSILQNF